MTARLDLEYDGTDFAGWARQPGLRTVEGELARALATLLGGALALTVAGRTDRGVHARGQVVSYEGPPAAVAALNALLPHDLVVRSSRTAPAGFDARDDAVARGYATASWPAAAPSAFRARPRSGGPARWIATCCTRAPRRCPAATTSRRSHPPAAATSTCAARCSRRAGRRTATCWRSGSRPTSFLRHMNRTLVGTMLEVAGGRRSLEAFAALLNGAPRAQAGPTAAPHGLCLESVRYPA